MKSKYSTYPSIITYTFGSLRFEHNLSSTQMRRLTNPALTRCLLKKTMYYNKQQKISDLNGCGYFNHISFKLIALNHSANSLYYI